MYQEGELTVPRTDDDAHNAVRATMSVEVSVAQGSHDLIEKRT